jgi:hypothetical protein
MNGGDWMKTVTLTSYLYMWWCILDHKNFCPRTHPFTYVADTLRLLSVTYATYGRWSVVFARVNNQRRWRRLIGKQECKTCNCWMVVRDLSHGGTVFRILVTMVKDDGQWGWSCYIFQPIEVTHKFLYIVRIRFIFSFISFFLFPIFHLFFSSFCLFLV